jgi:hypothetical protein
MQFGIFIKSNMKFIQGGRKHGHKLSCSHGTYISDEFRLQTACILDASYVYETWQGVIFLYIPARQFLTLMTTGGSSVGFKGALDNIVKSSLHTLDVSENTNSITAKAMKCQPGIPAFLLNAGHCNHVHYVNMPCTVNNFQIN